MKLCRLMLGLALCLTLCACAPEPGPAAGDPDPKSAVGQEQPEEPPVQPVSPEKPMPEGEGEEIAPAPEEDTGILPPSEENPSDWAPSEPEERIDPWAIQEKRSLNVRVVNEDGNPSPNIAVTVRDTFAETEGIDVVDVWIGVSLTDATGYVNRPFKDLPVMPICITLENRSIPASDPLRFQEHYYTAEEVAALPEELTLTFEGPNYVEATEELCPTILEFRVTDEAGQPLANASVEFYCSLNPNNGKDGKFLDDYPVLDNIEGVWEGDKVLTAGGYTDADGVYLYGFQSQAGSRDGFCYIARASYNGKTGPQKEVELSGGRTVLELTVGD